MNGTSTAPQGKVEQKSSSTTNRNGNASFHWQRLFGETHPYDGIDWETRTAKIVKSNGQIVFEQKNVEVPSFWTQTATDIVASKYFRGKLDSPDREYSAKQMVDRVAKTVGKWGLKDGYFASAPDAASFIQDLTWLLINQYAAFNSPVWFNVGVFERPQCSACQPYRALISSPRGFFKIGEIVENKLIGLPIYDSAGTTKVIAVKNNGVKRVYKVILRNGTFIETTGDHLIRVVSERRTKPFWIRVDQLKKGMRLHLYPHRAVADRKAVSFYEPQPVFNAVTAGGQVITLPSPVLSQGSGLSNPHLQLEISEAALAGWLQADGFVGQYKTGTNRSLTIEFLTINDDEKRWIESHLKIVFPEVHKKIRVTKTKRGTPITRIRLYGEKLRYFVEKFELLKRRKNIRVPDIMWKSNSKAIAAYLRSVFQGEGYISIRKFSNSESSRLAIATISKDWIYDIQILLFGLGIYSRVKRKLEKRSNRMDLYELSINNGSEKKKFQEVINFISNEKQTKLISSLTLRNQKNIGDLREEEVISIDEVGAETVYDIQTESGEYLTNNVVVHNCFILSVDDNIESILEWYRDEGMIFRGGSGSGTSLTRLRSSMEPLSRGGFSSGPVSFMKGADGVANSIRSGGTTRRAAKMVVLDADHPDIKDFIYCKKIIEDMTKALALNGFKDSIAAEIFDPYTLLPYQNANNSVRVTDAFMRAVEADGYWELKARTTGETLETLKAQEIMDWVADAAWHSADPGMQYDTTINEWHTCPNTGRINASNPCSEYMHLDNSACNLASLNLTKFLGKGGKFNVELFKKAVDTMILAQDILVDNSSYPTPKITENAKAYRQLGLGYANLGSLLMLLGLPYDSEAGRMLAGHITSLMCGEAYRMSTLIADCKGPFAGYQKNKDPMLGIIAKHLNEAEKLYNQSQEIGIPDNYLETSSRLVWHEALDFGNKYGVRNSQATVLAPTGTISFLMDCATTGIEPDLMLVKYKKLVGGGTLKLVNNQVPVALRRLGYLNDQIEEITNYILETGTIEGAPYVKDEHLSVFDCSFKAHNGTRSISYMGHLKMMAAVQPFISGAISKTINLPADATVEDVKNVFIEGWRLGLKAVAIYRDGSKSIQPLNTKDDDKMADKLVEKVNGYTRRKLPDERPSITHKFSVGGYESYLTVGFYPDTMQPGETFLTTAKEGSTVSGLFDTIATLISMALQSGVPLKQLVKKFKDMRFDPAGFTENPDIPTAKSIVDYVFRYLGMKYLSPEDKEEIFGPGFENDHTEPTVNGKNLKSKTDSLLAGLISSEKPEEPIAQTVGLSSKINSSVQIASSDAPVCQCGTLMVRAGACFSCPNCFATTGVCN